MKRIGYFRTFAVVPVLAFALSACVGYGESQTVSSGPPPSLAQQVLNNLPTPVHDAVVTDLHQTEDNFANALYVGKDVANFAACSILINQDLGIDPVPGAGPVTTAQMTNKGLLSNGAILVVDFLDGTANGLSISIPQDCLAAYGQLQLQANMAVLNKGPGGQIIQIKQGAPLNAAQRQTLVDSAVAAAAARAAAQTATPPVAPAPAPAPAPVAAPPANAAPIAQ